MPGNHRRKIARHGAISVTLRLLSGPLLAGPHHAAARSMLYPFGVTDEDFSKPIIGIAST